MHLLNNPEWEAGASQGDAWIRSLSILPWQEGTTRNIRKLELLSFTSLSVYLYSGLVTFSLPSIYLFSSFSVVERDARQGY